MPIITRDFYKRGAWNAVSDQDGQKRKSTDMRLQWDGLWVGADEFDPKHPQLELRPRPDNPARHPVRNAEPKTVNLPDLALTAEVYDAQLNPYLVTNIVLGLDGLAYVVGPLVLDADGIPYEVFTAGNWWEDLPSPPNTLFIPPPLQPVQML